MMKSLELLSQLEAVPADRPARPWAFRDQISALLGADGIMYAAEYSAAASLGIWAIFDEVNVDDRLQGAYEAAYPGLEQDHSLHQHWREMMERGPEAQAGFINGLKGRIAEFEARDQLTEAGWTVESPASATHPGIDLIATSPDGLQVPIQVKYGGEGYAGEVTDRMAANPDVHFMVNPELHDQIVGSTPELVDQLTAIEGLPTVDDITDGLTTLSDNLGIDIPDGVGELLPYAGVIIAAARLIAGAIQTENTFSDLDRTDRNKVHVVQTITLMSRMGVTTVLATVGGMGGAVVGTAIPMVGNLVGGIGGAFAGAGLGMYLNRHLQPHMMDLALNITGLEHDDLFYFKNKGHIDGVALSMRATTVPSLAM